MRVCVRACMRVLTVSKICSAARDLPASWPLLTPAESRYVCAYKLSPDAPIPFDPLPAVQVFFFVKREIFCTSRDGVVEL